MDIYRISQNHENFKFFVYADNGISSKKTLEFNGQSLKKQWTGLNFQIFVDNRKKKDNRSDKFDASCYYPGILIVNRYTCDKFIEKFKDEIEALPVEVNIKDDFFFINLLVVIDCIKKEGKSNSDIMSMIRENRIVFSKENISSYILFRDNKLTSSYFCTKSFIDFIESNKITGLKFDRVGEAV